MESLTGLGELYGTMAVQAKQMAVDEINAAGGINGRMLKIIVADEKCTIMDAITAYNKLTGIDGVKIILGTTCSDSLLGVAPLAEEEGVVMFSGLASDPAVTTAGDYIFRTSLSDLLIGFDTGNTLWVEGHRTLATISERTYYPEIIQRTTAERFLELGGTIVAEERPGFDVVDDYRPYLERLISQNPDALHISTQYEFPGGTIIKQARELGWQGPIYSTIVEISPVALEIAGDAATGVKGIATSGLDPHNTKAQEVLRNFKDYYGYLIYPWYLGSAYDTVYITAECLKRTNDDQDADGLRDCLYDITWNGTIGTEYSFDENGDIVGVRNVVAEVLPVSERTDDNQGYRILGPAPVP